MMTAGVEPVAVPAAASSTVSVPAPRVASAPAAVQVSAASFALKEEVVTAPAASLIAHIKQNAPPPVPVAGAITPEAAWVKVIALATGRSQKALLAKLALESVTGTIATVVAPHDCFELAQAADAEIEASLVNILGRRVKVEIRDGGRSAEAAAAPSQPAATSMVMVEANPLIKRATELFGARIVSVQPRRSAAIPAPSAPIPPASASIPRESDDHDAAAHEISGDE